MANIYFWYNTTDLPLTACEQYNTNPTSEPDKHTFMNLNNYLCDYRWVCSSSDNMRTLKTYTYRFTNKDSIDVKKLHIFYANASSDTATVDDITEYLTITQNDTNRFSVSGLGNVPTSIFMNSGQFGRMILYPNYGASESYTYTVDGLTNCSCNKASGDTVTDGDTITITADSGYEFNPDSNYTLTVGTTTRNFAVSEDKTKLTFTDIQGDANITISNISPDKVEIPNVYTVTANLTNVTADSSNPTTVNEGNSFTLSYTADTGYEITTATANIGTVTISQDKKTVTITGTATENIVVTVSSEQLPTYTIRTLTHCTANKATGDIVNVGDILTITAETGYYFNAQAYTLTLNQVNKQFTISSDKTVLTYNVTTSGNIRTQSEIIATLIPSPTVGTFLHIYNVTVDELNEIAKNRFYTFDSGEYLDYGKDILKLYRCYIPISEDIQSKATIQIGNLDTTISSTEISDNVIKVETDIITSGMEYENDYTAELFIPNDNSVIRIPIEHAFNKTIHIKLTYELYDGVCQYVLTDNGVVFDTGSFNFASDIPFRGYDNVSVYEYNYNPPIYNYCVLVVTGKIVLNVSDITTEYMNGTLLEFANNTITDNDYDELLQIFRDGVYIN